MMDLTEAFGAAFRSTTVPNAPTVHTVANAPTQVSAIHLLGATNNSSTAATLGSTSETSAPSVTAPSVTSAPSVTAPSVTSPDVYVLNVEIGKDDCHLLCVFLLVFSLSFILSNRK